MSLVCSIFFTFNLVASALMVKQVFPHMSNLVARGVMSRAMKLWILGALVMEGAVAALSFLALFESNGNHSWLLGSYAIATANIYAWVWVYHLNKWGQNER
jgi:hypothetical protein